VTDRQDNHNVGNGQAVIVRMVGYDKPLLTFAILALSVSLSLVAIFTAYRAEREARMAQFYYVECIQNGICPEVKRGE